MGWSAPDFRLSGPSLWCENRLIQRKPRKLHCHIDINDRIATKAFGMFFGMGHSAGRGKSAAGCTRHGQSAPDVRTPRPQTQRGQTDQGWGQNAARPALGTPDRSSHDKGPEPGQKPDGQALKGKGCANPALAGASLHAVAASTQSFRGWCPTTCRT